MGDWKPPPWPCLSGCSFVLRERPPRMCCCVARVMCCTAVSIVWHCGRTRASATSQSICQSHLTYGQNDGEATTCKHTHVQLRMVYMYILYYSIMLTHATQAPVVLHTAVYSRHARRRRRPNNINDAVRAYMLCHDDSLPKAAQS